MLEHLEANHAIEDPRWLFGKMSDERVVGLDMRKSRITKQPSQRAVSTSIVENARAWRR